MPSALITGGTSGIGRATALALHDLGHRVAVTGVNPASIARARDELPRDITVIQADAGDLSAVDTVKDVVAEQLGSLDLLFLNAGTFEPTMLADVAEASFDRQVDVNLKGPYFTLQKLLPQITDGGSVVLTVGVGARLGSAGASLGAATRGALLAMVPSLALELAPRRITVNSVSPGPIDTSLFSKLGLPDDAREAMRERVPLGRFGSAQDVAGAVTFLASEGARFITGQDITVAGGYGLGA